MRIGIWTLIVVLFFAGCGSKPEDLILGTWQFDHLSVVKGAGLSAKDSLDVVTLQTKWGLNNITWEFLNDKTFTQSDPEHKITGDYEVINSGKEMLLHTAGYDPKKLQLITLTKKELAMGDMDVPYITHWKKEK